MSGNVWTETDPPEAPDEPTDEEREIIRLRELVRYAYKAGYNDRDWGRGMKVDSFVQRFITDQIKN